MISEGVLADGALFYERPEEVGRIGNSKTSKIPKLDSKEEESSSDPFPNSVCFLFWFGFVHLARFGRNFPSD